ncbi:MAG: adenylate/guanylate cyclase domain-containing protein [Anaerolineaceae bacterium]|nr:adenylate/guanylate cyclase domain-containing protein [Anaerolineaceae bacterium]
MENKDLAHDTMVEEFWRDWFNEGPPKAKIRRQRFFKFLPAEARCKFCFAPFDGYSASFVKHILQVHQSRYNPYYCNTCDDFSKKFQGGAEVPIAMLFADIRGSTTLAEKIGAKEFSYLINRFYIKSTSVLSEAGAMIEKLVGDEVTAVFSRGMSGENYFAQAINAARILLQETGHADENGPWAPVGIGIHAGEAFVGSVGRPDGIMEVAALGDVPNTAARLTSLAGPGEILVSEATILATGLDTEGLEKRQLTLKGREEGINAFVLGL